MGTIIFSPGIFGNSRRRDFPLKYITRLGILAFTINAVSLLSLFPDSNFFGKSGWVGVDKDHFSITNLDSRDVLPDKIYLA